MVKRHNNLIQSLLFVGVFMGTTGLSYSVGPAAVTILASCSESAKGYNQLFLYISILSLVPALSRHTHVSRRRELESISNAQLT